MITGERGVTLTELTVVIVLASVVALGLVMFYLNSQASWLDASAQAITQREATLLIEHIDGHARQAASATVSNSPNGTHQMVILNDNASNELCRYYWNSADSLVHWGDAGNNDRGPLESSKVTTLTFSKTATRFSMTQLQIRTARLQTLTFASTFALYNHP